MSHSTIMPHAAVLELNAAEIDAIAGGDPFGDISIGLGAAATVAGGLAAVPTPASPALVGFAVLTGLMSAGAAYLSSVSSGDSLRQPNVKLK